MYINKILIFMIIILLNACSEPQDSTSIPYQRYLDGNVRSFDIYNDTLFVASEDAGIVIYEIASDSDSLKELFSSNIVGIPVTLDIAENSRSLIVLDDYNHTYIGSLDWDKILNENMGSVTCDDYQRKSAFIDYSDKPIELITPFRHKPTQNEVDPLAWDTSFLHRIKFDVSTYELGYYYGDCSDTLYQYLNYDIEDVYYNNEKLYLVNPHQDIYSIITLDHDLVEDTFIPSDTLLTEFKPHIIKTSTTHMFIGSDDGCYIKLLDTDNVNDSNFKISSGYTIQDIQIVDNYIALSAGYGGALVYEWNENGMISDENLVFMLGGVYAYKTFIYNDSIIVGTKNGLQIYKMER